MRNWPIPVLSQRPLAALIGLPLQPVAEALLRRHRSTMKVVTPTLLRTRAIALLAIGLVTVTVLGADLIGPSRVPMILPIMVAYFLFNFGFVFIISQGGFTMGTRWGAGAVVLNFVAMFLSNFELAWRAATAAAVLASVAAAYMLFRESRAVMA